MSRLSDSLVKYSLRSIENKPSISCCLSREKTSLIQPGSGSAKNFPGLRYTPSAQSFRNKAYSAAKLRSLRYWNFAMGFSWLSYATTFHGCRMPQLFRKSLLTLLIGESMHSIFHPFKRICVNRRKKVSKVAFIRMLQKYNENGVF